MKCIDGEMLAAWTSGALRPSEAARVEEHLADCARCQAMLAAFARSEPEAVAAVPWWQRGQIRWLVPIATAATVVAIYIAVPQQDDVMTGPVMQQRRGSDIELRSAPATPPPPSAPLQPFANEPPRPANPAPLPERRVDDQRASKTQREEARAAERAVDSLAPVRPGAPASAPVAPPPPPTPSGAPATLTAPAAVGQAAAAESGVARERELLAKRATAAAIATPDGATRWRLTSTNRVERSTDRGANWRQIDLPAGVALTAGHAPSASVAWFVGRGGAIVVTTDAARFDRVAFIDARDLVNVVAIDDRQATVTTVDGVRYRTSDRGKTWTQQ